METDFCLICFNDFHCDTHPKEKRKEMSNNIHTISLTFTTDRPLSDIELDTLKSLVIAQIEEPVTEDGDDVDYTTNLIEVK